MERQFKGFYLDKEGKQKLTAKDLRKKIEEAEDPEITVKLSDLKDINKLLQKFKDGTEEITFYGKFE